MRQFGVAILLVAALAEPVPAIAADAIADGPGCLGVAAATCVGALRRTMVVNEPALAQSMAHRHQVDVNGRPLGRGLVIVEARLPDRYGQFVILLHLRPDDTVASVESNLRFDLLTARTETVYDQSGLYDIVTRLLGRRCRGLTRLGLYRFFENAVKPRIIRERQDFSSGLSGLHRLVSHAVNVPFCGVMMSYTSLLEWRGTKHAAAAAKLKNFSSIALH